MLFLIHFQTDLIRKESAHYLRQISVILSTVPREMLLIFKTNDLLRGVESSLKVRADAGSLLTMSRCCITALAAASERCNIKQQISVTCWKYFHLTRLKLMAWVLWLKSKTKINTNNLIGM